MTEPVVLEPSDEAAQLRQAVEEVFAARDQVSTQLAPDDAKYQTDPIGWITDRLGVARGSLVWSELLEYAGHRWDGTPDPLVVVAEGLAASEDVGIEAGTATGKSYLAACLILWFLAVFRGARVFSFAPKEAQLKLYIWAEISMLWPRFSRLFPAATLQRLAIRMDGRSDTWGAWGYAVGVDADAQIATRAAGMHAEHMLLVYEEMPGIHTAIIAAGEQTSTATHNLRLGLGNPDSQHDALHAFCTSPGVRHVRISALDHPNIVTGRTAIPGAVSQESIDERRDKYGEDSPLYYQSRVRGISPAQAVSALIRREWCQAAVARYQDEALRKGVPTATRALGVDVANSEDGDRGAIAEGVGACCLEVRSFPCPDANQLGRDVLALMKANGIEPPRVGVDSAGIGAATVNELRFRGVRGVRALNGGHTAYSRADIERWQADTDTRDMPPVVVEAEEYRNLRAQMWWQARHDLQLGLVAMPNDEELIRDLTTPTWELKSGKITVEGKEDIRERLRRSPDKGDAFVLWNWVRARTRPPKPTVRLPDVENRDIALERSTLRVRHGRGRGGGSRRRASLRP